MINCASGLLHSSFQKNCRKYKYWQSREADTKTSLIIWVPSPLHSRRSTYLGFEPLSFDDDRPRNSPGARNRKLIIDGQSNTYKTVYEHNSISILFILALQQLILIVH